MQLKYLLWCIKFIPQYLNSIYSKFCYILSMGFFISTYFNIHHFYYMFSQYFKQNATHLLRGKRKKVYSENPVVKFPNCRNFQINRLFPRTIILFYSLPEKWVHKRSKLERNKLMVLSSYTYLFAWKRESKNYYSKPIKLAIKLPNNLF